MIKEISHVGCYVVTYMRWGIALDEMAESLDCCIIGL